MSQNLHQASHEWQTRPADERFETLDALYVHTLFAATRAKQQDTPANQLRVRVSEDGDLRLVTPDNELKFNNWSFSQLNNRADGPNLNFIRRCPPDLAAQNLNWALGKMEDSDARLWFDGQSNVLRAATTPSYTRILNHEVVKAVIDLNGDWRTPPARPARPGQPGTRIATAADCIADGHATLGIKPGDTIAPAGLYGSDRNIFIFRINPKIRIEDGSDRGLARGFFVRNSEVGDGSYELTVFWFREVCGNHIVWDVSNVQTKRVKHVGRARTRALDQIAADVEGLATVGLVETEQMIQKARTMVLGKDKTEVVESLYGRKRLTLDKKDVQSAFDIAEEYEDVDGDPTTVWGMSQGLTRLSQTRQNADQRTALDKAAGQVLCLVE